MDACREKNYNYNIFKIAVVPLWFADLYIISYIMIYDDITIKLDGVCIIKLWNVIIRLVYPSKFCDRPIIFHITQICIFFYSLTAVWNLCIHLTISKCLTKCIGISYFIFHMRFIFVIKFIWNLRIILYFWWSS